MTSQVNGIPCEIKEKPNRMYYKNDWRCDCNIHTLYDNIKILNNIFQVKNAHWFEFKNLRGEDDSCFWVKSSDNLILVDAIRSAEYHGLMLSSIHIQKGKLSLSFKPTGWYS